METVSRASGWTAGRICYPIGALLVLLSLAPT